ncbi:hypothetical protein AURDEDRAFT_174575 [Auricularia subglabra TFB-10046 SS5]|uniref:Uncharacterized protein n=1 Tax=Auricularia subglabra (strain TFB-10046 / SS5) TaxID=717982 RepID=J0D9C0_AURST|nr:hypothetical protein AURDEDRAFT_174575 [Auricularia subglabra TFB-10046 SS5]
MNAESVKTALGEHGSIVCEMGRQMVILRLCVNDETVARIKMPTANTPELISRMMADAADDPVPCFCILPLGVLRRD